MPGGRVRPDQRDDAQARRGGRGRGFAQADRHLSGGVDAGAAGLMGFTRRREGAKARRFSIAVRAELVEAPFFRSEEHTSELQSLMRISYAVFCLKKKKNQKHIHTRV